MFASRSLVSWGAAAAILLSRWAPDGGSDLEPIGRALHGPTNAVATDGVRSFLGAGPALFVLDAGQEVSVNRSPPTGRHSFVWDGRDRSGASVASGLYLVRLEAGGVEETRRVVLLK